ncbi:hypothetical protein [Arsenophonus sp. ENCA]|uniref:hypothetical protein n=1 Tax=Arsenophonus sp. ENCA TaxID=1987579 RepID=UPI0025BC3A2F|nr:hypothetical protein [Arsenophonus sp. ENCA]
MNNFGIGNKHGYIRLSSDSSMNATVSDGHLEKPKPSLILLIKLSEAGLLS